jgi:uncharacterized membrane protein YhaH (DUF805 family)
MFLLLALQEFGSENGGAGIVGAIGGLIYLAVLVLMVASMWKIFDKAGQPGWAAIIPIYNVIVLLQIVGRPLWWFILMLIPVVGFIIGILVVLDLAKSFGQGVGFAIGLLLLPFIFGPILGFGDASYRGPAAA